MGELITTGLSQAFWRIPEDNCKLVPARIPELELRYPSDEHTKEVCWFDHLLEGGILIPSAEGPALVVLLEGAPGTGKTILATELCYRLAVRHSYRSLYLTSEAPAAWLIENCRSLGWDQEGKIFRELQTGDDVRAGVAVFRLSDPQRPDDVLTRLRTNATPSPSHDELEGFLKAIGLKSSRKGDPAPEAPPSEPPVHDDARLLDVLVIDNLNTPSKLDYDKVSRLLVRLGTSVTKILVIVLDTIPDGPSPFWDFVADMLVRLETRYDSKTYYLLRTIQIVKARYQQHVWGVHQLKLYEPPKRETGTTETLMRMHPHREEGGVFIFPSIHYFLSKYKRRSPGPVLRYVESAIPDLNDFLPKGYPVGRCTALIGGRGSYKSHLGYLEILWRILSRDSKGTKHKALIVSLRDDEGMARSTIEDVLTAEKRLKPHGVRNCADLEQVGLLEILYYAPGSITPEEFFHRLLVSVHRLKDDGSQVSLLFNSVDQIGSNFPLCANEPLFVPGIIHMLSAEEVTSLFVAAAAPGQPQGLYGLESTAELMLTLERNRFERAAYLASVRESGKYSVPKTVRLDDPHWAVTVTVVRFPSGRPVGNRGFLELVSESDARLKAIFKDPGLHFVPSAPDPVGEIATPPTKRRSRKIKR
jgi:KaiC/GvpD/RAD55 family RecA-like ATPase